MTNYFAVEAWIRSIAFLIPISWFGIVIIRRAVKTGRIEVLLPAGVILGVTFYTFLLNGLSYLVKPPVSIWLSYLVLIAISVLVSLRFRVHTLDFPKKGELIVSTISLALWGFFLFVFIGKKTDFGGDVDIYYSIAKTFARGNFPIMSPWQPDLTVGYHYGASIFLGAFNWFTGLSFDFLHRILAFILILSSSQILIFFKKRHENLASWTLYQLIPVTFFILVGTFMIVTPVFPVKLPEASSLREVLLWASNLPSVHISFETWGAAVTLGLAVYFLHQFTALAILVLLIFISVSSGKGRGWFNWALVIIVLSVLALTNESVFLPAVFMTAAMLFLEEVFCGITKRKLISLSIAGILVLMIVLLQGGIITETIFNKNVRLEESMVFFPKKENIVGNFQSYHSYQQSSKNFPIKEEWKPLKYYHVGLKQLYFFSLICAVLLLYKKNKEGLILFIGLFAGSVAATLAYNFIVPKFKIADGNRLMSLGYQLIGIAFAFWSVWLVEEYRFKKHKLIFSAILLVVIWMFSFSALQPFAELIGHRSSTNNLLPSRETIPETTKWIIHNIPRGARFLSIDEFTPYSPRTVDMMTKVGVFSPSFSQKYRAYTLEGSPEYIDLAYTLNPSFMEKFKISHVLIDSEGFKNLPSIRKKDLLNPVFFTLVYDSDGKNWEKIFSVNEEYIKNGDDLGGTFKELDEQIPDGSSVYIDDWEDTLIWSQHRKSVIFALKDKKPMYVWGPGVYLNVLADIYGRPPQEGEKFEYLVLFKDTKAEEICTCRARLIWSGIGSNVNLWKTTYEK